MRPLPLLVITLLAAGPAAAINKCVDKNGRTTYQEAACPSDVKADVIRVAPAPEAPPAPEPAKAAAGGAAPEPTDQRLDELVATQANYERCLNSSPEFAKKYAADYEAWRSSRAELFAKLEASPQRQAGLEAERRKVRDAMAKGMTVGYREGLAKHCEEEFMPSLKAKTGR